MPRYDAQREAELVARKATLENEYTAKSTACRDLYDKKGEAAWDVAETNAYMAMEAELRVIEGQLRLVNNALTELKDVKPIPKEKRRMKADEMAARYMRRGLDGLSAEEKQQQGEMFEQTGSWELGGNVKGAHALIVGPQMAAMSPIDDTGSHLVDTETLPKVVETLAAFGGVRKMCQTIKTAMGNTMTIPRQDATSQKGSRVAPGAATPTLDLPDMGHTELGAYTYLSLIHI